MGKGHYARIYGKAEVEFSQEFSKRGSRVATKKGKPFSKALNTFRPLIDLKVWLKGSETIDRNRIALS